MGRFLGVFRRAVSDRRHVKLPAYPSSTVVLLRERERRYA